MPDILESLEDNTLISLRIEGHTDRDPVTAKKGRRFTNNDELSFFRAQTFSQILNTIVKEQAPEKAKNYYDILFYLLTVVTKKSLVINRLTIKIGLSLMRLIKTVIEFGPADSTSIAKEAFKKIGESL